MLILIRHRIAPAPGEMAIATFTLSRPPPLFLFLSLALPRGDFVPRLPPFLLSVRSCSCPNAHEKVHSFASVSYFGEQILTPSPVFVRSITRVEDAFIPVFPVLKSKLVTIFYSKWEAETCVCMGFSFHRVTFYKWP